MGKGKDDNKGKGGSGSGSGKPSGGGSGSGKPSGGGSVQQQLVAIAMGGGNPSASAVKSSSGGSGSSGKGSSDNKGSNQINIGGKSYNVAGNTLNTKEVQKIADKAGVSVSQVLNKASNQDIKASSGAKTFVKDFIKTSAADAAAAEQQRIQDAISSGVKNTLDEYGFGEGAYGFGDTGLNEGEELITLADLEAAKEGANLEVQRQIAQIQNAGATERLKYEVDNRIPVVQAEAKGKLDLQKIVNSGYKEIAQIERGAKMMSNITSMFNF
jgi:hypothetical protein